jgi:broad specificity phosphatase PhoE
MSTAPSQILIIRHGEKPGDPSTDSAGESPDLSTQGYERAASLAVYVPATFGKPDVLFATQTSKNSNRPVETITPLAAALGLAIDHRYADDDYPALAAELFAEPKYAGKCVLICWHHGNIPALASALGGVPPTTHWKGHVFDRVWKIDYPASGATTGLPVVDIPQMLMYGDSST